MAPCVDDPAANYHRGWDRYIQQPAHQQSLWILGFRIPTARHPVGCISSLHVLLVRVSFVAYRLSLMPKMAGNKVQSDHLHHHRLYNCKRRRHNCSHHSRSHAHRQRWSPRRVLLYALLSGDDPIHVVSPIEKRSRTNQEVDRLRRVL